MLRLLVLASAGAQLVAAAAIVRRSKDFLAASGNPPRVPPPAGTVPGLELYLNLPSLRWQDFTAHPVEREEIRQVIHEGAYELVKALETHAWEDKFVDTQGPEHASLPEKLAAPLPPASKETMPTDTTGAPIPAPKHGIPTGPLAEMPDLPEQVSFAPAGAPALPVTDSATPPMETVAEPVAAAPAAAVLASVSEWDTKAEEAESFMQLGRLYFSNYKKASRKGLGLVQTGVKDPKTMKKEDAEGALRIFVEFEKTPMSQVSARITAKGSQITPELVEKIEHEFETNKSFYEEEVHELFVEMLKDTPNVDWAGEPDVSMREEAHDVEIVSYVHECTDHTKNILANLKKTYTPVQVPYILEHNCDVYMTMFSFDTERGTHTGTANDGARCELFTHQLTDLFWHVYEAPSIGEAHFGVARWCKEVCDTKFGSAPECDAA